VKRTLAGGAEMSTNDPQPTLSVARRCSSISIPAPNASATAVCRKAHRLVPRDDPRPTQYFFVASEVSTETDRPPSRCAAELLQRGFANVMMRLQKFAPSISAQASITILARRLAKEFPDLNGRLLFVVTFLH
jgi:hypothetical protein